MKEKYQAAFIIPQNSSKTLTDNGWEFQSSTRISSNVKDTLVGLLGLVFIENYLGIESYANDKIKMSVILDETNEIESIHFQLHADGLSILSNAYQNESLFSETELFTPQF